MEEKTIKRRKLVGEVVSLGSDKTRTVRVDRFVKHPKYGKYQKRSKKFKVHDENNAFGLGDKVEIEKCRPISKDKHFRIVTEASK